MTRNATTLILPSRDVAALEVARVGRREKLVFGLINKLEQHCNVAMRTATTIVIGAADKVMSLVRLICRHRFLQHPAGLARSKKLDRRSLSWRP